MSFFLELSTDVLPLLVFSFLDTCDLCRCELVCSQWKLSVTDGGVWASRVAGLTASCRLPPRCADETSWKQVAMKQVWQLQSWRSFGTVRCDIASNDHGLVQGEAFDFRIVRCGQKEPGSEMGNQSGRAGNQKDIPGSGHALAVHLKAAKRRKPRQRLIHASASFLHQQHLGANISVRIVGENEFLATIYHEGSDEDLDSDNEPNPVHFVRVNPISGMIIQEDQFLCSRWFPRQTQFPDVGPLKWTCFNENGVFKLWNFSTPISEATQVPWTYQEGDEVLDFHEDYALIGTNFRGRDRWRENLQVWELRRKEPQDKKGNAGILLWSNTIFLPSSDEAVQPYLARTNGNEVIVFIECQKCYEIRLFCLFTGKKLLSDTILPKLGQSEIFDNQICLTRFYALIALRRSYEGGNSRFHLVTVIELKKLRVMYQVDLTLTNAFVDCPVIFSVSSDEMSWIGHFASNEYILLDPPMHAGSEPKSFVRYFPHEDLTDVGIYLAVRNEWESESGSVECKTELLFWTFPPHLTALYNLQG